MTLHNIVEVKNDGMNCAVFNTFLQCLSIEDSIVKALQTPSFPIGALADIWLTQDQDQDQGVLLCDIDKLITLKNQDIVGYVWAFHYHSGTIFFGRASECVMIARLHGIKNRLYSDFGKNYLEKLHGVCYASE